MDATKPNEIIGRRKSALWKLTRQMKIIPHNLLLSKPGTKHKAQNLPDTYPADSKFESESWEMAKNRKASLKMIYEPVNEWRSRYNHELYYLYNCSEDQGLESGGV